MHGEALGLLSGLSGVRPAGERCWRARLGEVEVAVVRLGVGPRRARARAAEAIARWPGARVWNLGTCGALVPGLGLGEVLVFGELLDERGGRAILAEAEGAGRRLLTVRRPVVEPARRGSLAALGAIACDMEAFAVHEACLAAGRELRVVKVVSDQAGGEDDAALPASPGRLETLRATARFSWRAAGLLRGALLPRLRALGLGSAPVSG